MKTFVAVVVGQGANAFVQSIHVAAKSYRNAAAIVLRQVRRFQGVRDFQISLRALEEDTFCTNQGILMASSPVHIGPPGGKALAS